MGEDIIVATEYAFRYEELKELALEAYNTGRRHERIARMKKRKRMMENIKFFLVFGMAAIGMPVLMFCHWLAMGY